MFDLDNDLSKYEIGKRIYKSRKKKKLTQEKLAEMLGVDRSTLSAWENGRNTPEMKAFSKLCRILDVDLGYLVGDYNESAYSINQISKISGLSEKAIERLKHLKEKSNGNIEIINAISMLLEECQDFPYMCLDFYSLCINLAQERKSDSYVRGLTNDDDTALTAFMIDQNISILRDKLVEKMKNEKTDYYIERVYLPVFSSQQERDNYYSKKKKHAKK